MPNKAKAVYFSSSSSDSDSKTEFQNRLKRIIGIKSMSSSSSDSDSETEQQNRLKRIFDEFEVPECRALADFGTLFEQSLFTDCVLVAKDGIEFKAHKNILACRSAVFRAMFEHEMVEAKEGIVNIKDIKSPVLEQMLRFIYTGKAPKLGEMPVELFQAADIYGLDRLKILCEQELAKSLGNVNVCGLLVLANQYGVEKLKQYANNYIEKHIKEVIKNRTVGK